MSWNYMQPNAELLKYAGAGMNNLGAGLLNMSQQVQEIPYHEKRLGLLDAQRNATNNQGLLWKHQAENQNIKNQSQYQIDQSNIANTYAQMRLTDAKAQGQNIENTYKPKSIMADINNKNAHTGLLNANTDGQNIQNQYAPLHNNNKLIADSLQNQTGQSALNDYHYDKLTNAVQQELAANLESYFTPDDIKAMRGDEKIFQQKVGSQIYRMVGNPYLTEQIMQQILGRVNNMKGANPQPTRPQQPQHPQAFSTPTPKMLPGDYWNTFGGF